MWKRNFHIPNIINYPATKEEPSHSLSHSNQISSWRWLNNCSLVVATILPSPFAYPTVDQRVSVCVFPPTATRYHPHCNGSHALGHSTAHFIAGCTLPPPTQSTRRIQLSSVYYFLRACCSHPQGQIWLRRKVETFFRSSGLGYFGTETGKRKRKRINILKFPLVRGKVVDFYPPPSPSKKKKTHKTL